MEFGSTVWRSSSFSTRFCFPFFFISFLFDRYSSGMGVVEREQRTGCNELQSREQISMRIRYRRCLVGYGSGDSPFGIYRMARILLFFFCRMYEGFYKVESNVKRRWVWSVVKSKPMHTIARIRYFMPFLWTILLLKPFTKGIDLKNRSH